MRPRIESSIGDDAMEDCGFLKFTDDNLKVTFLQALSTMRKHRLFCDVVINVDNSDIHAHKNVLACVSPHLMELFSAEQENQFRRSDGIPSYRLNNGLTKIALQILVDYAYTGILEVPDVLVKDVYLAAWKLRIENIINECARHLISELCADSCIETRSLPGINKNKRFVTEVDDFIEKEFAAVSKTSVFCQLPCATIDVLYQTKQEMIAVSHKSLCRLVLDWIKRQLSEDTLNMVHLLERSHLLYLAVDNSLQDCSDLPPGQESDTDIVQDYKRLVLKCPNNKGRRKCLGAPVRPRVLIYSRDIGVDRPDDKSNIEPDWNVIGSEKVGDNTFIALTTLNGALTRISIQLRLNLPQSIPSTPSTIQIADPLNQDQQNQQQQQQPQRENQQQLQNDQPKSAQKQQNKQKVQQRQQQQQHHHDQQQFQKQEGQLVSQESTDSQTPELFHEVATMSGPKCGLGVAEWNGKLLVCGGYDRGECLKTVESYSPELNQWVVEASMREARGRVQIAVLNDVVYAVGGSNGTTELDTVECFRKDSKKWEKLCKLPLARSNAGVCALNNQIYCIGGWNGQSGIKQCEVYQPSDDKWTSIAPLQTGRYQAGVAAFKQKLWVAGGSDAWNCLGSVETYDPETNQWSMMSPLLTPRRGCGLAAFNGKLYAVGGSDGSHSLSSTEIYDNDSKTWILGPNLTTSRSNVSVLAVKGKLYAIGGFAGKCFLNTIEYLDENTNEWTTFVPKNLQQQVKEEEPQQNKPLIAAIKTGKIIANDNDNDEVFQWVNYTTNGNHHNNNNGVNGHGSSDTENGQTNGTNGNCESYRNNGTVTSSINNSKSSSSSSGSSNNINNNNNNNNNNNHNNNNNNGNISNIFNNHSDSDNINNINSNNCILSSEGKIQEKLAIILENNKEVSYGIVTTTDEAIIES